MKKLLLTLGTTIAIVAPIASVIACGSNKTKTDATNLVPANASPTTTGSTPWSTQTHAIETTPWSDYSKLLATKTTTTGSTTSSSTNAGTANAGTAKAQPTNQGKLNAELNAEQPGRVPDAGVMSLGMPSDEKAATTKGLHVLVKNREMDTLATGKRSKPAAAWHVTLDQAHLDKAVEIREYMNKTTDAQWHTYGDSIIDGINAIRLAISEDLNGNRTLKHMIRDFADNGGAISNPGNAWNTDNRQASSKDNEYQAMAKKQINNWFDKDEKLTIVRDYPGWANIEGVDAAKLKADPSYKSYEDKDRHKLFDTATAKSDTLEVLDKNYGALTLGTPELLTAQHRAQEVDWLGEFDGHDHGGTMKKIQNHVTTYKVGTKTYSTGELSKAPTGDEGFKNEDYMFPYTYNNHKFEEGSDFVSGLLTAIDVLYDTDDGSHTTGHRTNFYSGTLTSFGWSRHASNSTNFQYILTEAGGDKVPGSTGSADDVKAHSGLPSLLDNPLSATDLAKVETANPFLNEYTKEALKYLSPMTFLNEVNSNKQFIDGAYGFFMADNFSKQMIAELYKPHADEKAFEKGMEAASPGYGDNFDFKQLSSFYEYPRFAKPQATGRPDTFVKTYDYNGGSTITGEQYGVSLIDKTLFE